jgi:hypothetical protein
VLEGFTARSGVRRRVFAARARRVEAHEAAIIPEFVEGVRVNDERGDLGCEGEEVGDDLLGLAVELESGEQRKARESDATLEGEVDVRRFEGLLRTKVSDAKHRERHRSSPP